jgi:hypothetical protein
MYEWHKTLKYFVARMYSFMRTHLVITDMGFGEIIETRTESVFEMWYTSFEMLSF